MTPTGKRTDDQGHRHSEGFRGHLSDEDHDPEDYDLSSIYEGWGFDDDPEDDD